MKFFISGPYSASHPREVLKNVNRAIDIGIELMRMEHAVYIPHLTHYIHLRPNCPFEYKEYLYNDIEFLKVCDAIFFIAHSDGADGELMLAKQLNKRIYYDLRTVPNEIKRH